MAAGSWKTAAGAVLCAAMLGAAAACGAVSFDVDEAGQTLYLECFDLHNDGAKGVHVVMDGFGAAAESQNEDKMLARFLAPLAGNEDGVLVLKYQPNEFNERVADKVASLLMARGVARRRIQLEPSISENEGDNAMGLVQAQVVTSSMETLTSLGRTIER